MQNIIGWDVGGAHLKAARVENGIITQAVQIPCPLWLGLGELDRAFTDAEAAIGRARLNAITMTANYAMPSQLVMKALPDWPRSWFGC
jgi:(4-(4-[2-(gamma-L-glutamylamino)ethyl]phenoxymethyl)furan-2-yl)methanamine synthase